MKRKNMKIDWNKLNFLPVGHRIEVCPETISLMPLLEKVLKSGEGCVSRFYREGYSDIPSEEAVQKFKDIGGRIAYEYNQGSMEEYFIFFDDGVVEYSYSKPTKLTTFSAISTNEKVINLCKDMASKFASPQKKGYVFVITKNSQGGLQLTRFGYAGAKLERGNYSNDVLKGYDYVIKELKSKDPSGRLAIFDGAPGNGKTRMIRGMLMDIPNAMFVLVPPSMVSAMGGPELLPLLMQTKDQYGKSGSSIIFILEDADDCLAPRASDNMSSISSILNMGDGILGSLLDARIIATTNAKSKNLDAAIVRDGRLSKRISINPFSYSEANVIFKRIIGKDEELPRPEEEYSDRLKPLDQKNKFSLAEIYKAARDFGWVPEEIKELEENVLEHYEPSQPRGLPAEYLYMEDGLDYI